MVGALLGSGLAIEVAGEGAIGADVLALDRVELAVRERIGTLVGARVGVPGADGELRCGAREGDEEA